MSLLSMAIYPLNGYTRNGSVYSKTMDIADPRIDKNKHLFTSSQGRPLPKEIEYWEGPDFKQKRVRLEQAHDEEEKALFGVEGSYAYACAAELFRELEQALFELYRITSQFPTECPSDITMVHEGAHVAFHPHEKKLIDSILCLVPPDVNTSEMAHVLGEAVPIFVELKYLNRFHLGLAEIHGKWRSADPDPVYMKAYRIATENQKEMQSIIDDLRGSVAGEKV